MLQPGERIDNHDKVCAEYYATLLKMGAYDDEYAFFGTTYIENGKRRAFISGDRLKTYEFVKQCHTKEIYPTPVENLVKRLRVHSGEKELVGQQLKLEFAKSLKAKYPGEFLEELQEVALCPINNSSVDIIGRIRDNLEGCFDEDALQLFKGVVSLCYDAKTLTSAEYYKNLAWLELELDFLKDKVHKASNFKRNMTGFAYQKDGKVKYYTNAVEERTYEKRNELLKKGQKVTPIYEKEYYFNSFGDLPKCLAAFDEKIRTMMDADYLELIALLYELRPEIDDLKIGRLENNAAEKWNPACVDTLNYYKTIWHM